MHTPAHTPTTHTHPFTTQNLPAHTYTHTKTSPCTGLNLNWQSKMVSWLQIFIFSYSRLPGLSFSRWANNARLSQSWEIIRPGFLLPTQSPTREMFLEAFRGFRALDKKLLFALNPFLSQIMTSLVYLASFQKLIQSSFWCDTNVGYCD